MRRLLYTFIPLLVVGLLAVWGNSLLGRVLDSQLAPLLTRVLGLPVTLSPIKARALSLTASSDELIMGDAADPAVEARGVQVRLSLRHLLEGEVRFIFARADDLSVNPSRWPKSGKPLPENYHFLEQWLPDSLQLAAAQYVTEGGFVYPVHTASWSREGTGKASVKWLEDRGAGEVQAGAELASLDALLSLAPVQLALDVQVSADDSSHIAAQFDVAPASDGGYQLQASIDAAEMRARFTAGNNQPWQLPDHSETHIDHLLPGAVVSLVRAYLQPVSDPTSLDWLDSPLPQLTLIDHQGTVTLDKIRLGEVLGLDTHFNFTTSEAGVHVDKLSSKGPRGLLGGTVEIAQQDQDQGWQLATDLAIEATEEDGSIAGHFNQSRWLWRNGQANLSGTGATWGELLYSMTGQVKLTGHHSGDLETPISIVGRLDSEPGDLGVEALKVSLGQGSLTGSMSLSGTDRRKLTIDLVGKNIDLGFLLGGEEVDSPDGLPLPEYLKLFPGVDLEWHLDMSNLRHPNLALSRAQASLTRDESGGTLSASAVGDDDGTLELKLVAEAPPGAEAKFSVDTKLDRVDMAAMFRQEGVFYSRSSGTVSMASRGHHMQQIFEQMRGHADLSLELRPDNDWRRSSRKGEMLTFSGDANLVIDDRRIIGLQIDKIDVQSLEQDLTGSVSLVDGRAPWLIADLESESLNVTRLLKLLPKSSAEADQRDLLQSLRTLGEAQLSLDAATLVIGATPLSNTRMEILSQPDLLEIKQLDFGVHGSELKSRGKITWKGELASLDSYARLDSANLDQFVIHSAEDDFVPVSGTLKITSEGRSVAELIEHVSGAVSLSSTQAQQSAHRRRKLVMQLTRLHDGMKADISSLQFGDNDLSGKLRMREGSPGHLTLQLDGGTLSLLTWERKHIAPRQTSDHASESVFRNAARHSASLVSDALRAPLRMFSSDQNSEPGDTLFSDEPLPLAALTDINLTLKGRLDELESTVITAKNLQFSGELLGGRLDLTMNSAAMNGGSGELSLQLDSQAMPPLLDLDADFRDIRGLTGGATYPRSGVISLTTSGHSSAALAANVNGLVYVDLGAGPFDYANSALLTADIATSVFRNLIPGIESHDPTLECGVVLGAFQNGMGVTPYGYALRTNQANVLGRIELNLATEQLHLTLDSRGREGVGISVGSVFSNAIQVEGTLAHPRIVPNSTGILWRGWAAFMTAGLSIVGESVIKRALASDNPCGSIKRLIKKDLCSKSERAAASDMICPKN